jgi:hypothetical protein
MNASKLGPNLISFDLLIDDNNWYDCCRLVFSVRFMWNHTLQVEYEYKNNTIKVIFFSIWSLSKSRFWQKRSELAEAFILETLIGYIANQMKFFIEEKNFWNYWNIATKMDMHDLWQLKILNAASAL